MTSAGSDQFLIPGTFNYRDVAGARTGGGAKVRSGILMRSAELSRLDGDGHATLLELGITDVHDLRGHAEIDYIGHDSLPEGVRLNVTPFDPRMGEAPPHEARRHSTASAHMLEVYRRFPALPEAHTAIAALADSILAGTALVHCAAGKDRTGWAVATVLRAVDVTEDDIFADYLRSNDAVPTLRAIIAAGSDEELSDDLLGVRADYLAAGTASMVEMYGGIDGYLVEIGITPDRREALRARLLE
ncbi:tyrosine-protein phosphatase [Nocardia otitidiscaviarum]|uniref:Protein tyrosine/serine phosphatase n=1 Tax=Nocardia otitidiscaviarum TaxID=1823 RepID=A0A378Y9J0_9NOCA|nr:tyrosine-protein phosphatase [Nocardia otitidiscaviarum]MBF6131856.1 tyrosine-protein phosphatase [Nocardia otitidiscaviarum]MBF6238517.1 tyrosine-protein phosphatase [Nocardia otitidiscaviarum]MBF6482987.1 tyrosine-protein phosphatase [Nocardia otitidiscaviarum]SUA73047.1 Protein tyrosine/serine phosphatase [Nocardia otitidiscaviarum]